MHTLSSHTARAVRRIAVAGAAIGLLALLAALIMLAAGCGDDGKTTPGPTVTVTVEPSASGGTASGSPSPKPSLSAKKQLAIAAASGPKANGVSVVGSTGTVKQLVAPKGGAIRELAWSPDAARLAYVQAKSTGTYDGVLWVYDLANATTKPVLIGGGKPYAVAGYAWVAPTQLIVAAFEAKGVTYRTNATFYLCDVAAGTSTPVVDGDGKAVKGVWPSASADATAVAFVRYGKKTGGDLVQDLMLFDADTLSVKKVAHGTVATDFDSDAFASPRISPDGSLIYTVAHGSDVGFSCTVYRVNGSKAYKSPAMIYPTNGSWDAGSGRLAFGGGPAAAGGGLIDGVNIWKPGDSSADLILSGKKTFVSSLAWTPKGKQIVYCSSKSYPSVDLWVVNADGSGPHLLLKNGSAPACAQAPISFK